MKFRPIPVELAEQAMQEWAPLLVRDGDCVLFMGQQTDDGYGFGRVKGYPQPYYAHRVAWVARHRRDVPEGLVVDHLCRHRNCVSVHHLDPVTQAENLRRGTYARRLLALGVVHSQ